MTFPNPRVRRKTFPRCRAFGGEGTRVFQFYSRTGLDLNAWEDNLFQPYKCSGFGVFFFIWEGSIRIFFRPTFREFHQRLR